jgi:hypothetical protein
MGTYIQMISIFFDLTIQVLKLFGLNPLKSGGYRKNQSHPFAMWNRTFPIGDGQCWKWRPNAKWYDIITRIL